MLPIFAQTTPLNLSFEHGALKFYGPIVGMQFISHGKRIPGFHFQQLAIASGAKLGKRWRLNG
jgi:hypothetical protein